MLNFSVRYTLPQRYNLVGYGVLYTRADASLEGLDNNIIQLYSSDKASGVLVSKVGYILGTGVSAEVKQDLVLRVNSYVTQGNQIVRVRPFLVVEKDGETVVIYDTEAPEVSLDIDELFTD